MKYKLNAVDAEDMKLMQSADGRKRGKIMIGRLILMFIPSAISLSLLGIYLIMTGTSMGKTVLIILAAALLTAWLMARIVTEDAEAEDDDERG